MGESPASSDVCTDSADTATLSKDASLPCEITNSTSGTEKCHKCRNYLHPNEYVCVLSDFSDTTTLARDAFLQSEINNVAADTSEDYRM